MPMKPDKVSIIIPVYNVERYLDRCVESVLRQTYPDFEVLLIDDGSTDHSGTLCDQWAEKDPRVRVTHKENRGVSAARNIGLDSANGEYIAFVDSDDYIAADMVQKLYHALKANHADLSICRFYFADENGDPLPDKNLDSPIIDEVLSGYEAIQKLVEEHGWYYHVVWNKLYRRSLFSEIRFPEGIICGEDAYIAHRLFGNCTRVASIRDACYYYTQRAESVTHRRSFQTLLNDTGSFLDRAVYCHEQKLYECSGQFYWRAAMGIPNLCAEKEYDPALRTELDKLLLLFRRNYNLCSPCTVKEKLQIALVLLSPRLYQFFLRNPIRQKAKAFLQERFKRE